MRFLWSYIISTGNREYVAANSLTSRLIFSLIAEDESGTAVGLCNYVCHLNTWSDQTVCYLEDLYVSPDARRLGVGTKLISELTEIGRREHWFRIYWITNADNEQARAAYDKLATRTDHVRYEIAL